MTRKSEVALALLLAWGLAFSAHAQVRQTDTYYDEHRTIACADEFGTTAACALDFSQLPATKQLNFTNVSCAVSAVFDTTTLIGWSAVRSPVFGVSIAGSGDNLITNQKLLYQYATSENGPNNTLTMVGAFNHPVRFLMGAGRYPRISVETGTPNTALSISMECTIVGTPLVP